MTKEILERKKAEAQEKINSWVSAINMEAAKIAVCEELLQELVELELAKDAGDGTEE